MQEAVHTNPHTDKVHYDTLFYFVSFHALAIVALFYFSWANLAAMLILWWAAGSLGVGLGYHRLLTHRSFKTPKWLEYTLVTFAVLSLQGSPIGWVGTHRIHHAHTETDHDPHSPRDGHWWAHIGWLFTGTAQSHSARAFAKYVPDLLKDPFYRAMSTPLYIVPTFILGGILFLIGGWTMVLWGIFVRAVIGWHSTFLVNSATHGWGSRRFETRDDSTNNGLIAIVSFGEGWHNNHHAHPTSARHGLTWYEFDLNWLQIKALQKLGLAEKIKVYNFETESVKPLH